MKVLVETAGLTKVFGDVRAVDDLTVQIPDGAIGLVGPNGAGKTTFLRLLLSLLQPTAGTAKVLGRDIGDGVPVRERIGYMPEHDCLIPDMTGVGLVSYMGRISGLDRDTAMSRSHDVLQFVGVEEERYRKIAEYSTGMKQKIKLAQSMVHDPQLYIFDEPTTGLDPRGRTEMLDLVRTIAKSPGRNVLLSSHLLPDVETICKYVVILDGGHQIAAGELSQLLTGSTDRLRIDVRGDQPAFARLLKEAGLEAGTGATGVHVTPQPGRRAPGFGTAQAPPGQRPDLTFFAVPASNGFVLFFVSLMAAVIGAGLIADDMQSMAFTLYMSRPITQTDYLLAKAAILAPLVAMVTIVPLLLTALVAALLGRVSWAIAVEAMGVSLGIGGLLTAFYHAVTLFLSSLTRRKGIAAAGVVAVNFGLTVPAGILATRIGNPAILYLSPWDDYVAVASVAFGATPTAIDWLAALAVLLGVTVLAALVTYLRMRAVEVITG